MNDPLTPDQHDELAASIAEHIVHIMDIAKVPDKDIPRRWFTVAIQLFSFGYCIGKWGKEGQLL